MRRPDPCGGGPVAAVIGCGGRPVAAVIGCGGRPVAAVIRCGGQPAAPQLSPRGISVARRRGLVRALRNDAAAARQRRLGILRPRLGGSRLLGPALLNLPRRRGVAAWVQRSPSRCGACASVGAQGVVRAVQRVRSCRRPSVGLLHALEPCRPRKPDARVSRPYGNPRLPYKSSGPGGRRGMSATQALAPRRPRAASSVNCYAACFASHSPPPVADLSAQAIEWRRGTARRRR